MTDPNKNLWQIDDPTVPSEIMLNSDMSLAYTILNNPNGLYPTRIVGEHKCSHDVVPGKKPGCINPLNQQLPSTYALVNKYAYDNDAFLKAFAQSYVKMSSVGYSLIPNKKGKFGSLTPIQCDA
jgi:hypothetical protein